MFVWYVVVMFLLMSSRPEVVCGESCVGCWWIEGDMNQDLRNHRLAEAPVAVARVTQNIHFFMHSERNYNLQVIGCCHRDLLQTSTCSSIAKYDRTKMWSTSAETKLFRILRSGLGWHRPETIRMATWKLEFLRTKQSPSIDCCRERCITCIY